ncbi:hypothetical protein GCM10022395_03260 [Snuella lapsa]|uniref:TonB-dependent receptor plug domain-containing protein n=1 Tax=Snuella lapsa TaxID=870481 RepID=A0ABP6WR31_9FLAO
MKIRLKLKKSWASFPLNFDLKMKLTTLFLIVSLFQLQANESYAQKTRITLDLENVSLERVLDKIESLTEFKFIYKDKEVDYQKRTTLSVEKERMSDVLKKLFKDFDIAYKVVDKQIILKAKKKPGISIDETIKSDDVEELPQEIEVTGTILDSNGQPLPGANVLEKGTTNGIQSDFDGKFSLTVAGQDAILVVSYVGFLTKEIIVGNQTDIKVTLVENAAELAEVVVVGFGTQKKANVTGATGAVDMEDVLGNRPVTNPIAAIQGTIPGLQITTNSGQPGASGLGINIRGTTSINGGSPLILMNNVPVSIEDINPQDVQSITVLKDASATSIYGARAAFGVILITTKTPARDQPVKFNYSSTFSLAYPEDIPDKASTYDFINALNDWGTNPFWTGQNIPAWVDFLEEYKTNPGAYPEGYAELDGLRYPLADTDLIGEWINDLGLTQIHNFNFSGGGEKSSYRVSAGYSDEDGIIVTRNDSYRKYNVNAALTSNLTSKLTSTTNIIYRYSTRRTPLGSFSNSISFNPYTPAKGNFVLDDGTEVPYDTPANRELLKVAPKILNDNIRFFQKLDYNLVKGLNIVGEYTFEKRNYTRTTSDNQILTANPE